MAFCFKSDCIIENGGISTFNNVGKYELLVLLDYEGCIELGLMLGRQ